MIYVLAALVLVSALQMWLLCLVVRRVGGFARVEERVSSLTHTIALLTDTTETCFNVVAARLEPGASQPEGVAAPRPTRTRAARQRRVLSEASNGRSVPEIAADEEVAESEVALRLAIARRAARWEELENGAMRS
jgi:hypothetical protein